MPLCLSLQQSFLPLSSNGAVHTGSGKRCGIWRIYRVEVAVEKDPGKDSYHLSDGLLESLSLRLRCKPSQLQAPDAFSVVRKSFDARKHDPRFVYIVDLDTGKLLSWDSNLWSVVSKLKHHPGRLEFKERKLLGMDLVTKVRKLSLKSKGRVVVVGSGPAGLFAALSLAEMGVNVTLVERGYPVEKRGRDIGSLMVRRILNPDSNFCYGEGGAGTWSDGKLTTRIGKNGDDVQTVLRTLVRFGASENILFEGKPHIGTDKLVIILRRVRAHLQSLGVQIMFGTKMEDIVIQSGRVTGIHVSDTESFTMTRLPCDSLVLAVGHSAWETYTMLLSYGVLLTPKDFAVGFRVEHPQELVNNLQYRAWSSQVQNGRGKIPVADYKVAATIQATGKRFRSCYSFCMCPGGQIVPTSTDANHLCINGMSFSKRASKWANAALVVNVTSLDLEPFKDLHGPLAGVAFQRALERQAAVLGGGNYVVPVQRLSDFLEGKVSGGPLPSSSYRLGVRSGPLHELLPKHLTGVLSEAVLKFNNQLRGFVDSSALLHAVETRTSATVTIARDEKTFESVSIKGLYPVGEGAGYAGGIVSAAVDGMKIGLAIGKIIQEDESAVV